MASFGETLKRERELREITLRQVAVATKINLRYLEALEQDRFEVLPGGLFNKGFIRAYAVYIGVDPEAMVDSYLHALAARVDPAGPRLQGGGDGGLHRPADLPPRRAAPGPRGAAAPRPTPGIRFAAPTTDPPAPAPATIAPPAGPAPLVGSAPPAGTENHHATHRPPAIHAIAEATPRPPERQRALLGVLLLVAGAALIFVLLGLITGHGPGARRSEAPVVSTPVPVPAPGTTTALPEATTLAVGEPGPAVETGGAAPTGGDDRRLSAPPPDAAASLPPPGSLPAPSPESPAGILAAPRGTPAAPRSAPAPPVDVAAVGGAGGPAPAAGGRDQEDGAAAPTADSMELELTATQPTFVNVLCDQRNAIYGNLEAGETRAMTCHTVIKISAHDAGAVRLRVNGADCMPMGEPGARAYGYTIRIDDFDRICRPAGRRFDGRS